MIALTHGGMEVDLAPEIGGSVTRFTFAGRDVLRPTPEGVVDVRETGCFPLVPYANRIELGVLHFQGREYRIQPNLGQHPHPLHGHGWHTAWRVVSLSRDQATLAFDHEPDDWPWAYAAEETFTLTGNELRVRLGIRSRDAQPMPISLGFHPYFPRMPKTRLTAKVEGMWLADDTMVPTNHVDGSPPVDLAHGALLWEAPFVDNCFTGWRQPAIIEQPDLGLSIKLDGSDTFRFFHTYIPVGQTFFCAEPVTAMPNAFNRPEPASVTGARVLASGESFAVEMRIGISRK